jgi:hypothetical protein
MPVTSNAYAECWGVSSGKFHRNDLVSPAQRARPSHERDSRATLPDGDKFHQRCRADFVATVRQVRSVSLTEQWETAKADFRKQRAVVAQAVTNAGAIEAQIPELHRIYGEARLKAIRPKRLMISMPVQRISRQ